MWVLPATMLSPPSARMPLLSVFSTRSPRANFSKTSKRLLRSREVKLLLSFLLLRLPLSLMPPLLASFLLHNQRLLGIFLEQLKEFKADSAALASSDLKSSELYLLSPRATISSVPISLMLLPPFLLLLMLPLLSWQPHLLPHQTSASITTTRALLASLTSALEVKVSRALSEHRE